MCGRFTLTTSPEQLSQEFPWLSVAEDVGPRYNIAPTQPIAVVPNDGKNQLDFFVWGLIPSWAKDPSIGNRMINARAETLSEKPAFKAAFRHRRCLILADGFFEWRVEPGQKVKTPMYIRLKSGKPFVFAGLWENWHAADGSQILSCTIITTEPNDFMRPIHNRMPVILPQTAYPSWLEQQEADIQALQSLLIPYPSEELTAYPVSRLVNSPGNDYPEVTQAA